MRHENNLINYATPPYPTTRRDQNGSPVQALWHQLGRRLCRQGQVPQRPPRRVPFCPSAFPHHDSYIDDPPFKVTP